jgi:hypothetical protein
MRNLTAMGDNPASASLIVADFPALFAEFHRRRFTRMIFSRNAPAQDKFELHRRSGGDETRLMARMVDGQTRKCCAAQKRVCRMAGTVTPKAPFAAALLPAPAALLSRSSRTFRCSASRPQTQARWWRPKSLCLSHYPFPIESLRSFRSLSDFTTLFCI